MRLNHLRNLSVFFASRARYLRLDTTLKRVCVSHASVIKKKEKILIIVEMRCVFFHRCAPTVYNKKYFDLWRGMEPLCVNTTVFLSRNCVTEKSLTCSLWWLTCLKWALCSVSMLFGLCTIPSRILSCEDLASPKVVWLRFGSSVFSHAACILIGLWKKKSFVTDQGFIL